MRPPKKLEVRYPTVMATNSVPSAIEGQREVALIDGQATPMSVSGRPDRDIATKASTIRPISALPTRTDGDVSPECSLPQLKGEEVGPAPPDNIFSLSHFGLDSFLEEEARRLTT